MQKLVINQMIFPNGLPVKVNLIADVIKNRLAKANIKIAEVVVNADVIVLQGKDKLFTSTVENKIDLTPTDPRIKSLGRNYLLSKRLNVSQYDSLFAALKEPFDDLGIMCDIVYTDDSKTEKWRTGKTTTFPTINTKLLPKKA